MQGSAFAFFLRPGVLYREARPKDGHGVSCPYDRNASLRYFVKEARM
jgi:hypothetical protein